MHGSEGISVVCISRTFDSPTIWNGRIVSDGEIRIYFDGCEPQIIECIHSAYGNGFEEHQRPMSCAKSSSEIYEKEGKKYKRIESTYVCAYGNITLEDEYLWDEKAAKKGNGTRIIKWLAAEEQPPEVKGVSLGTYSDICPINSMGKVDPNIPLRVDRQGFKGISREK